MESDFYLNFKNLNRQIKNIGVNPHSSKNYDIPIDNFSKLPINGSHNLLDKPIKPEKILKLYIYPS